MSKNLSGQTAFRAGLLPLGLILVVVPVFSAVPAVAQIESGRRIYEEQLRVRLDQQKPSAREIGFDAGGWLNFALFNYDDALGEKHTLRQYELRGWASLNIRDIHKFYIRGLWGYNDWNSGDNPKSYVDDEDIDPEIERAWYQFDLGRLLSGATGRKPDVGVKFKIGRAFADIGTALALSLPLDLVQIELEPGDWQLKAFLGKTIDDTTNIDLSTPVATDQERYLWGVELAYNGLDRHRPFAYFLSNYDHTSPNPHRPGGLAPNQDYDYSSQYVGIGSTGTLLSPKLRYRAELVGEWGKTYSEAVVSDRDDICAFAADVLLEYLFDVETKPRISVEYIFGSGDSDRRVSSSSTIGGNLAGTTDRAFNAFGFRDTGISFAPLFSNLHIYMIGASFFPLENHRLFKKLEVGTKTFFYHKDKSGGPISDTTANTSEQWVGWEWDVFCDWRITSDVSWTLRYGAFQPGTAFRDQDCRQFLFTAVTFSF